MSPAKWMRDDVLSERLLYIDPRAKQYRDDQVRSLIGALRSGDVLVVNDAATLPASIQGRGSSGQNLEARLVARIDEATWSMVLFGEGDWRTPTENRAQPERVSVGETLTFGSSLRAQVIRISRISSRKIDVQFDCDEQTLWSELYHLGRPIQYAYVSRPLALWHMQTRYASRPCAAELPSAGRVITWGFLLDARRRGIRVATVTHATSLSSTGDTALDAAMPWPEEFEIPRATVDAIEEAKRTGGRVIAVGTSVVRALEGCAALHGGRIVAERGSTELVISGNFKPKIVDGLLTGIHELTASHYSLLHAFASSELLHEAYAHAAKVGYLCHEFGDSNLILAA